VSQQELDAAVAKNDANLASVDAGRAVVRTATLNLSYTTITSPINGVMGRAQLRLGGLVTANTTVLTTLYQTDRMYVNFSISEQRLLTLAAPAGPGAEPGQHHAPAIPHIPCRRLRIPAAAAAELHRSGRESAHRHAGHPYWK